MDNSVKTTASCNVPEKKKIISGDFSLSISQNVLSDEQIARIETNRRRALKMKEERIRRNRELLSDTPKAENINDENCEIENIQVKTTNDQNNSKTEEKLETISISDLTVFNQWLDPKSSLEAAEKNSIKFMNFFESIQQNDDKTILSRNE